MSVSLRLQTPRLALVASDGELAGLDAAYDHARLGARLRAVVPPAWPPELTADVLDFFAAMLTAHPDQAGWWGWFIIREAVPEDAQRVLIGGGGFKGPPGAEGVVEIGYSILPEYQRCGFATEAMQALLEWAFADARVAAVLAETFPALVASQRVLTKLGFSACGAGAEPGTLRFGITRTEHGALR